jgi:Putative porin
MRTRWRFALLGLVLSAAASPSFADDLDELRKLRDTTISLVNALVEQGVLTRAKADAIIAQAEQAGAKTPATGAPAAAVAGTPNSGAAPAGAPNAAPTAAAGTTVAAAAAKPAAAAGATPGVASGAVAPSTAAAAAVEPGVVRVPYIPESVKADITNDVKQDVLAQAKTERWGDPGALPDWLQHFTWYGDMRLRFQADRFPTDNTPNAPVQILQAYGVNVDNSTEANNRLFIRARFGFDATVGDTVTVGMRLATGGVGDGSNPGSDNQTLGNYETRSSVGFDRAYLAYHPTSWFTLSGGRVGNPYFRPTTLVWADDVSLEGVVVAFNPQLTSNLTWFTTAGALPLLQINPVPTNSASSKWLYAYQSGFDLKFAEASSFKLAAALYDYRNIEGTPNPTIFSTAYSDSAAEFRQTGNTVFDINGLLNTQNGTTNYLFGLASKFHVANLSTRLDLDFIGPVHFILDGDWVDNLGFNEAEIEQRTGLLANKDTKGWQTRFAVGYPNMHQKYAWQAYIGYRYVQGDATVDAFTDQDFHLGGTDAKGYYLGADYAFEKNTYLNLRWFSAKQISGVELALPPGATNVPSELPLAIDVLQLDVQTSF